MDVSTLIKRVKNSNREAFNELYTLYYDTLLSYGKLFVPQEAVEDIIQDLFLRVWLNRDQLQDSCSLHKYLLCSVYHASLNYIKRYNYDRNYRSWYGEQIEKCSTEYYDPDKSEIIQKLFSVELASQIHQAIDSLPKRCKEVFKMSHIDDYSNKEISDYLGISISTVENHINSALKQLRSKLSKIEVIVWFVQISIIFLNIL